MGSHFFFGCAHLPYHSIAMMVSHNGRRLGLQLNSSSVAKRREGAAPQLSLRRLPQFLHPHHFQQSRRLHRQLRRQLSLPHPVDPWIPSIAQSILRTRGPQIRRRGAAESTTSAALSQSLQLRRWVRKLASRLVSGKEGVVLQSSRQGLSQSRRWLRDVLQALRLQCWFRKLDGGMVRCKEGLVLQ